LNSTREAIDANLIRMLPAITKKAQFLTEIRAIQILPPHLLLGENAPGISAMAAVVVGLGTHSDDLRHEIDDR
jgi:hypothetical protein